MGERNGGQWTEARFNSFVKGGLRGVSRRWPPKYECLNAACVGKRINAKSGREAKHFLCASCNQSYPAKDVQVDHINPIIDPAVGFVDWNTVVERMFCEKEFLQCLCTDCHKKKTTSEREVANKTRKKKTK